MIKIAASCGIKIYAPRQSRVSFFNSPYLAHFEHRAVDIYPLSSKAPSPVEGRVRYIYEFSAPKTKQFQMPTKEYLIAIETPISSEYLVRILHVKPGVMVGDYVNVDEPLGEMIRNGHFDTWTDRHLHVEIRPHDDLLRARGGLPIRVVLDGKSNDAESTSEKARCSKLACDEGLKLSAFMGKVVALKPRSVLVEGPKACIGPFVGIPVFVGEGLGILDGGVPHYGFGGVLSLNAVNIGDPVFLGDVKIGRVVESFADGFSMFEAEPFTIRLEDFSMKGISSYISLNGAYRWKFIPQAGENMNLDGEVSVNIEPQGQARPL